VELVEVEGALLEDPNRSLDAGVLKHREARATDAFVGVRHRNDNATPAGIDQSLGTRRAPMGVRTGFEIDVQGAVPGAVAGGRESLFLGVRRPCQTVEALAGEKSVSVEDDG